MARMPQGPQQAPVAARYRVQYAKRGRLRFASHRDFARALERALRRAQVPMAYSAGFSPHPKISYAGAVPTTVASEAEYLELGLTQAVELSHLRDSLDAALPPGFDVVQVRQVGSGQPALAEVLQASQWQLELTGVRPAAAQAAVAEFLATEEVWVERVTKSGRRPVDVRAAVVSLQLNADIDDKTQGMTSECAILNAVVRHVTPAVRPDDILGALTGQARMTPPQQFRAVRLAQGLLDDAGLAVVDPLTAV